MEQYLFNACQKSAVLLISADEGILISMISNVSAIANTPSQKASNRVLGFGSDILFFSKIVLL
jgi:hypothetical protein